MTGPNAGLTRRWLPAARFLLTAGLIWFVLARVEPVQAWAAIRNSLPWGPALVLLLLPLNLALQWLRWHVLVRAGGLPLRPGRSLAVMFCGFPLGLLTPGKVGELGRGALVSGSHDAVAVAGLTVVERALSLVGGVGIAALAMIAGGYGNLWKWAVILILYAGAAWLALHPPLAAELLRRAAPRLPDRIRPGVTELARRFVAGWGLAGRRATLPALAASILQVVVVLTQLTACYLAAGAGAPLMKVVGAWAVVVGAKYFLPVAVGDIGVRESLAVLIFADRGLPQAAAVGAALTIYGVNVLLPAVIGALVIAAGRRSSDADPDIRQRPSH